MILVDFGYHVYAISLHYSQSLLSYLLSLHDEGYSRNVSVALDLISTFLSFMFMLSILSMMYFTNDVFYQ